MTQAERLSTDPNLMPWRKSIKRYGLSRAIVQLAVVGRDTPENLAMLCRAYLEEQAEKEKGVPA